MARKLTKKLARAVLGNEVQVDLLNAFAHFRDSQGIIDMGMSRRNDALLPDIKPVRLPADWRRALSTLQRHASRDWTRPQLTCYKIDGTYGWSSDGHRAARVPLACDLPEPIVMPPLGWGELPGIGDAELYSDGKTVHLLTEDWHVWSKIPEGSTPLNLETKTYLPVQVKELPRVERSFPWNGAGLARGSVDADGAERWLEVLGDQMIRIEGHEEGVVQLTEARPPRGWEPRTARLPLGGDLSEVRIGVEARYLREAIEAVSSGAGVSMAFGKDLDPIVVYTGESWDDGPAVVVMPVRLL